VRYRYITVALRPANSALLIILFCNFDLSVLSSFDSDNEKRLLDL
jgi:hypothetical protein